MWLQQAAAKCFDEAFPTSYNEAENEAVGKFDQLFISYFWLCLPGESSIKANLATKSNLEGCPSGLW